MNVGSLFTGIGGFDLGFERAGMRVSWQCEQDKYCQRVLAKHWPDIPCYPDICELAGDDVEWVDVLCGGFPCQDLSVAGHGAGLTGERSGLWFEYLRIIREVRPRYVVVENVPRLRKYLGTILGGLAEAGYDTEWDRVSARDFGAPHLRQRLWLVAYPHRTGLQGRRGSVASARELSTSTGVLPSIRAWPDEPCIPRVVDGLPDWVDRMRVTGNALVPQIAEWIGRRLMEAA